jgi:hypothetical protein
MYIQPFQIQNLLLPTTMEKITYNPSEGVGVLEYAYSDYGLGLENRPRVSSKNITLVATITNNTNCFDCNPIDIISFSKSIQRLKQFWEVNIFGTRQDNKIMKTKARTGIPRFDLIAEEVYLMQIPITLLSDWIECEHTYQDLQSTTICSPFTPTSQNFKDKFCTVIKEFYDPFLDPVKTQTLLINFTQVINGTNSLVCGFGGWQSDGGTLITSPNATTVDLSRYSDGTPVSEWDTVEFELSISAPMTATDFIDLSIENSNINFFGFRNLEIYFDKTIANQCVHIAVPINQFFVNADVFLNFVNAFRFNYNGNFALSVSNFKIVKQFGNNANYVGDNNSIIIDNESNQEVQAYITFFLYSTVKIVQYGNSQFVLPATARTCQIKDNTVYVTDDDNTKIFARTSTFWENGSQIGISIIANAPNNLLPAIAYYKTFETQI